MRKEADSPFIIFAIRRKLKKGKKLQEKSEINKKKKKLKLKEKNLREKKSLKLEDRLSGAKYRITKGQGRPTGA